MTFPPTKYLPCLAFLQPQETELHLHPQHQPQRVFKPPPVLTLLLSCCTFVTHYLTTIRHSLYGVEDRVVIDSRSRIWKVGLSGEGKPRDVFYGAGDGGKAFCKLTRASDPGGRGG